MTQAAEDLDRGIPAEVDADVDSEAMMFSELDTSTKPIFTISEMAQFFFARTKHWVRWLESQGRMAQIKDPEKACRTCKSDRTVPSPGPAKALLPCPKCTIPVGTRRTEGMNGRAYTLGDIEEIAHALATNATISGTQLRHTLKILRVQGEMHGYL